jgi:RNA polymerase sigma-70 factor, ECF subfamily
MLRVYDRMCPDHERTVGAKLDSQGPDMSYSSVDTASDHELMALLASGDMAALGQLACRHQAKALSVALRLVGSHHQAEEICQEAFIRVYQASASYRPEGQFATWLYRIVVNLSYDALRRTRRQPEPLPQEATAGLWCDPLAAAQASELSAQVRQAVGALPERQRTAVILHRYEQLGHDQIAQVMQCSVSAVESLLVRAYQQLRAQLKHLAIRDRREPRPSGVPSVEVAFHGTSGTAPAA